MYAFLTEDQKSNQLATSMKQEILDLLKEFESKSSCIGNGSKEDLLNADQTREHFMVRRVNFRLW